MLVPMKRIDYMFHVRPSVHSFLCRLVSKECMYGIHGLAIMLHHQFDFFNIHPPSVHSFLWRIDYWLNEEQGVRGELENRVPNFLKSLSNLRIMLTKFCTKCRKLFPIFLNSMLPTISKNSVVLTIARAYCG